MSFEDYVNELSESNNKKKKRINGKYLIGIALLLFLAICFIGFKMFNSSSGSFEVSKSEPQEQVEQTKEQDDKIYVHVAGKVNNPGIVELKTGDRVANAISAAGGELEGTSLDNLNLAKKVEDGEQIIVGNAEISAQVATQQNDANIATSSANEGKVNINSATSEQLQTVSGIGPSKASKIISYREKNGKFKSVDDLSNISGFGEKTLSSIKDKLCV